jgi:S1-C subfamily serine protease
VQTKRRALHCFLAALITTTLLPALAHADAPAIIKKAKQSVVAVGTFQATRNPRFQFLGTGFVVGRGNLIATNAHVIPISLDRENRETLAVAVTRNGAEPELRLAELVDSERQHDLAVIRIQGAALSAMRLGDSATVSEGEHYLFTGFPIGSAIGLFPATHEAIIAALAPIAIPMPESKQLNAVAVRRLSEGGYPIFQLDATAYPGNSGSPLYSPATGEVVGVINMVFVKGTKEAALSAPSGISYAIPIEHLKNMLRALD